MSQDPFKKDRHLQMKLDEYHVEIPDFPMKPDRWGRFINILASPARNPLESFISTSNGLVLIKIAPMGAIAIGLIQIFISI